MTNQLPVEYRVSVECYACHQQTLFEQLWDGSEPLYRVYDTPLSIQQNPPPQHQGHDIRMHTEIRKPATLPGSIRLSS